LGAVHSAGRRLQLRQGLVFGEVIYKGGTYSGDIRGSYVEERR
jgi:hypothetical protein